MTTVDSASPRDARHRSSLAGPGACSRSASGAPHATAVLEATGKAPRRQEGRLQAPLLHRRQVGGDGRRPRHELQNPDGYVILRIPSPPGLGQASLLSGGFSPCVLPTDPRVGVPMWEPHCACRAPAQHRFGATTGRLAACITCHAPRASSTRMDGWSMARLISLLLRSCRAALLPRAGFLRRSWPLARGPPREVVRSCAEGTAKGK
jgi:hypothetical protein